MGRRWPRMGGFVRSFGQGTEAVPFRERVNWHGRKRVLRPAVYHAEVNALDVNGNTSCPGRAVPHRPLTRALGEAA